MARHQPLRLVPFVRLHRPTVIHNWASGKSYLPAQGRACRASREVGSAGAPILCRSGTTPGVLTMGAIWMLVHVVGLLGVGWLIRVPIFFVAIGFAGQHRRSSRFASRGLCVSCISGVRSSIAGGCRLCSRPQLQPALHVSAQDRGRRLTGLSPRTVQSSSQSGSTNLRMSTDLTVDKSGSSCILRAHSVAG